MRYMVMAHEGVELAQANAAYLLQNGAETGYAHPSTRLEATQLHFYQQSASQVCLDGANSGDVHLTFPPF